MAIKVFKTGDPGPGGVQESYVEQQDASEVANLDTAIATNPDVDANSTHRTTTTGNPHSVTASEAGAIPSIEKGAANGVATLDAGSKVPNAQLPALAITDTYSAANETEQLALTIQKGDVCVRTDENKSYINTTGNNTAMSDWQELLTPTGSVLSVDSRTGAVTLNDLYISTVPAAVSGNLTTFDGAGEVQDSGSKVSDFEPAISPKNTAFNKDFGSASGTVCEGDDARLSDDRDPTQHAIGGTRHSASTLANLNSLISDATLDDSGDARTPTAHAASHEGGADPVSPSGIGAMQFRAASRTGAICTFTAAGDSQDSDIVIGKGAGFPGTPTQGDTFFDTTTQTWYSWDATRSVWLPMANPQEFLYFGTQANLSAGYQHLFGIFELVASAQAVNGGSPVISNMNRTLAMLNVTTVNAAGTVRVTGTSYDPFTGTTTPGDTYDIPVTTTGYYCTIGKYWDRSASITLSDQDTADIVADVYIYNPFSVSQKLDLRGIVYSVVGTAGGASLTLDLKIFDESAKTFNSVFNPTINGGNGESFTNSRYWAAGTYTIDFPNNDSIYMEINPSGCKDLQMGMFFTRA